MKPTNLGNAEQEAKEMIEREKLEAILHKCEEELLAMSLVETQGGQVKDLQFQSPVFRFIWHKITKPIRDHGQFYGKGF